MDLWLTFFARGVISVSQRRTKAGTAMTGSKFSWGGPCTGRLDAILAIWKISSASISRVNDNTSTPLSGIESSLVSARIVTAHWNNGPVPAYSDAAPLTVGLDSLVGMGMNRVKLAIAVALAQHGGTLSTPELVTALEDAVAGTTIARNLHELEDHEYVTGDLPRDDRRRLPHWP